MWLQHQIHQKQILKCLWQTLASQRLNATRGFLPLICKFSTSQFLWHAHYLLCSAVNPTVPGASLPLNSRKEWIGIVRSCMHASGHVWFKRNHILYCSGSVDIFNLWHFYTDGGPFLWSRPGPHKSTGWPCLLFIVCKHLCQSFQFVFQCVLSQHQSEELLLFLWFISLQNKHRQCDPCL